MTTTSHAPLSLLKRAKTSGNVPASPRCFCDIQLSYIIPSAIVRKLIDDYNVSTASSHPPSELRLCGFAEFPALTQVQINIKPRLLS